MSLIQTVLPLLKNGSSLILNLKEVDGKIQVVIEPQLSNFDPETNDEVIATLQAVLVHPVRLVCERSTTDAQFIQALTSIAPIHESTCDQLAEYRQRLADAAAEAKVKAESKGKTPAKPVKAGAAKGAVLTAPADEGDASTGEDTTPTDATTAPAVSPAESDFTLF